MKQTQCRCGQCSQCSQKRQNPDDYMQKADCPIVQGRAIDPSPKENLDTLRDVIKLMVDNKLDSVSFGGITLTKSKHEVPRIERDQTNKPALQEDLDELLFHSTSAPSLSFEELAGITVTKIAKPRTKAVNE